MNQLRHGSRCAAPLGFLLLVAQLAAAQQSTVYAPVYSSKLFVVGAANPRTGLFVQRSGTDTTWSHVGPTNIRAFGVAVDRKAMGRVLYIASGNGLHKSSDGGSTWKITTGWEITEVLGVSCDPWDTNTVYIATAYGIYKTSDGCVTWQQRNRGLTPTFTTRVVPDHARPGVVYCAGEGGAFVSTDGAATWTRLGLSVTGVRTIVQHPRQPEVLAAGTENNGIYLSKNGGRWWTKCEAGIDHTTFYTIAFDPSNPDVMYAGGYVTGVYKSTNGGASWKRMNEGLRQLSIHAIAVDPHTPNRVYAGGVWDGMQRSEDGGEHWSSAGLPLAQIWTLVIEPF